MATADNVKGYIDGDWVRGYVFKVVDKKSTRLVEKKKYDRAWEKSEGADDALPNFDFEALFRSQEERR